MNMRTYLKKKNQLKYWKLLAQLIIYKSIRKHIIISEGNMSQQFRLKNIDKTKNHLIEKSGWIDELNAQKGLYNSIVNSF